MALEVLIDHITSLPLLAYPDNDAPFIVLTNASQYGLVMVLCREQKGSVRVIAHASRTLTPSEGSYHMHSSRNSRPKIGSSRTVQGLPLLRLVYTDNNPLTYVVTSAKLNTTGLRCVGELADFNSQIRYR